MGTFPLPQFVIRSRLWGKNMGKVHFLTIIWRSGWFFCLAIFSSLLRTLAGPETRYCLETVFVYAVFIFMKCNRVNTIIAKSLSPAGASLARYGKLPFRISNCWDTVLCATFQQGTAIAMRCASFPGTVLYLLEEQPLKKNSSCRLQVSILPLLHFQLQAAMRLFHIDVSTLDSHKWRSLVKVVAFIWKSYSQVDIQMIHVVLHGSQYHYCPLLWRYISNVTKQAILHTQVFICYQSSIRHHLHMFQKCPWNWVPGNSQPSTCWPAQ